MVDHLLPSFSCAAKMMRSSAAENASCRSGVELVAPAQATALARATGNALRDERPVFGAVRLHQQAEPRVLLRETSVVPCQ